MKAPLKVLLLSLWVAAGANAQESLPLRVQAGESLPPLAGVDLQGKAALLSQYPEKATVVLSFWSIHCADCIQELDDLRAIRREFPKDQVVVVGVNTDSGLSVDRIADFVRRYEGARGGASDVIFLLDRGSAIVEALGVRSIPMLLVADSTGRVRSIVSGYTSGEKDRISRAVQEGKLALGGWSGRFRSKVRSILQGGKADWGSFRVEEGMSLFGLYDARGWLSDAAGRRDRAGEARRVEGVVAERVKVSILRAALESLGIRLFAPQTDVFQPKGIEVPESALGSDTGWKRLYEALGFEQSYKEESRSPLWIGDEYHLGVLAEVDLTALQTKLDVLGFPRQPQRIRIETITDFDFKASAVLAAFRRTSYRLQLIEGQEILYFGDTGRLTDEIKALEIKDLKIYTETPATDLVRIEVL